MQIIWSRASQARSCQCLSCIHATTTLARRATTAASKSRLSANDVFTACYSAMFATAALVDMKSKDNRRKQWDMAIAEAKASSNVLPEISSNDALQAYTHEIEPRQSERQDLAVCKIFKIPTKCVPSSDLDAHKLVSNPRRNSSIQNNQNSISPPNVQGLSLNGSLGILNIKVQKMYFRMSEAAQMDKASKHKVKLKDREPRSQVHLERMQKMVWRLVLKLLEGNECFEIVAPVIRKHRIEKPEYTLSRPWMCKERKALDVVITKILEAEVSKPSNIDLAVSKICYNLLISAAPPSILTYNTMLIYFTRLKAHHLAQMVIDSFFYNSRFRPTFSTVAAILDHYAAIGDKKGFHSVILRMRGVQGHMRITRSTSLDPVDSAQARYYEPQLKAIHQHDRVVTEMPRNSLVFNSLILGSLRLFGVRRALNYFKAAIQEDCHISGDLFDRVGKACLAELDKVAAISLLSTIAPRYYQRKGVPCFESLSSSRKIILQMMDMCGIKLWTNGTQPQRQQSRDDVFYVLRIWLIALQTEVLNENIGHSAKIIKGLEMVVTIFTSKEFSNERIILGMLNTTDHYLCALSAQSSGLGVVVTAAQMVMDVFAGSFKQIEAQVFDSVYLSLPTVSAQRLYAMRRLWPNMDKTSLLEIARNVPKLENEVVIEGRECVYQHRISQEPGPVDFVNAEKWLANQCEGLIEWMKTIIV